MTREALNLRMNGACKSYKDFSLKQVTFEVPAGTIMGLIGQNGADGSRYNGIGVLS